MIMDVSIIVPVYKVEEYIGECIRSVMAQEGIDGLKVECIVVDDCSPDESIAKAHESLEGYAGPVEFHFIARKANGGLSAARNTGIRAARGGYVYFLDSDDVITPNCISALWQRVKEHPGVDIVTGDFETFPGQGIHHWLSLKGKTFPEYSDDLKWLRPFYLNGFPVLAWNKLIRRELIEQNNLYFMEGVLHEDNHWLWHSYPYVKSIAMVDKVTYLYRQRLGSITVKESKAEVIQNKRMYLTKIYLDIFSRPMLCDTAWRVFIAKVLNEYKISAYNITYNGRKENAYKLLVGKLINNPTMPRARKLALYYHMLGRPWMRYAIFNHLFR